MTLFEIAEALCISIVHVVEVVCTLLTRFLFRRRLCSVQEDHHYIER